MVRLKQAAAAASHDEAFALLAMTLDGVENEMSCAPNEPANWRTNGRLFPPQLDSARLQLRNSSGEAVAIPYRHNPPHRTVIGINGAMMIENTATGVVLFDKAGKDGRLVGQL